MKRFLDIVNRNRDRTDWSRLADRQEQRPRPVDPDLRERTQRLHRQLGRFIQASDPWMLRPVGVADADLPPGTDWH